jgi:hypothetical protein
MEIISLRGGAQDSADDAGRKPKVVKKPFENEVGPGREI